MLPHAPKSVFPAHGMGLNCSSPSCVYTENAQLTLGTSRVVHSMVSWNHFMYPHSGDPREGGGDVGTLTSPHLSPGRDIVEPNIRFNKDPLAL